MLSRDPQPSPGGGRRFLTLLLILAFVLLLTLRGLATFWTDYLWFDTLGLTGVWWTLVASRVVLVVAATVVAFLVLWINLVVAERVSPRMGMLSLVGDEELVERFQEWMEPRLRRVRLGLAAVLALLIGLGAAAWWENALLFINAVPFERADPVFGLNIGFYVFRLPLYRDLFGWLFQLLVVTLLVVAAAHYLNGGIRLQADLQRVTPGVKAHLSVLLAALAGLKAVAYRLDAYDLLYSTGGAVFGASYTDVNARLPALNLLALIMVVAAGILLVNIRFRGWTLPAVAGGLWLATSLIVGGIIPAAVQRFVVEPDEFNKERPYIERNIELTREAYDLDGVEVRRFAATGALAAEDLEVNELTIANIRLWDPNVLQITYRQLQEIRTYYRFLDVDVDRYLLDGELVQTMIAGRELDERNLPSDTWVNRRLVFTHGYGSVISPANRVTREGQPTLTVRDLPPQSEVPELEVPQPALYFGETFDPAGFVLVRTLQEEVDYPIGQDEVARTTYEGAAGVPAGGLLRRAAFGLRFGDVNTLISNQLTGETRVLMIRNIRARIQKVAPFLHPDHDPYLALVDGRLKWVQDLYTTTDRYPYSQPADTRRLSNAADGASGLPFRFNYVRNSVKAAIDAYDGTLTFYVVDPTDPLVLAYREIFPELFTDESALSEDLRRHLRYPEDLFRVQSDIYLLYHMQDPRVFYNNEDPWEVPPDPSTTAAEELRGQFPNRPMVPYYLLMRLPDEDEPSFLIMQPFTPRDRPNLVSFLIAKSDPGQYGELVDFQLPRDRFVDGPGQVGARINQDPDISREFTLLGQQGSRLIQGSMMLIPIEESLVYVQPVYLVGETVALPEFKRVIVVFEDDIVMRESLAQALLDIFGTPVLDEEVSPPLEEGEVRVVGQEAIDLLRQAEEAFLEAETALRAGDLATYAEKVAEARDLVQRALGAVEEPGS